MKDSNDLSAKIKFIKACRKLGATNIVIDGIQVTWDGATGPQQDQPSNRQTKVMEEKAKQIEETSNIQANVDHSDEQMSMLMIEDPLKFEQLIRERELEDAPTGKAYN